ncbi:MAG TPA: chitosanase, partial [Myxococcota bacterium]|nr:chitosanase [Myxococcota bacterium]
PWIRSATGGDPLRLASTYTLDGRAVVGYRWSSSLFRSCAMVAMMSDPQGQAWLDAAWPTVAGAREGYYEDTVSLLAMLAVDGRVWTP